jgi:hypothetical protein
MMDLIFMSTNVFATTLKCWLTAADNCKEESSSTTIKLKNVWKFDETNSLMRLKGVILVPHSLASDNKMLALYLYDEQGKVIPSANAGIRKNIKKESVNASWHFNNQDITAECRKQ